MLVPNYLCKTECTPSYTQQIKLSKAGLTITITGLSITWIFLFEKGN